MDITCGGHLTHGHPHNFSGKYFKIARYGVDRKTGRIDYDEVRELAKLHRPRIIITGHSSYSRLLDFERFSGIADEVGALLMADVAHIGGLIAAGLHPNPVKWCDFVTGTTHKTLRGPRGGFILCRKKFSKSIDTAIFPGIQGGPLVHVIAAKAVAFKLAMSGEFREYQKQILLNAEALATAMAKNDYRIVSGGTENHLMLVDLEPTGMTGKDAVMLLDAARITVNKNMIPFDKLGPAVTSGIRLGTPGVTTRGMKQEQMYEIAQMIHSVLSGAGNAENLRDATTRVRNLTQRFPVYRALIENWGPDGASKGGSRKTGVKMGDFVV
jgi:glycine hydroxymethyltransferase